MESNERFYARRAVEEMRAAERSLTPEGRARHRALAEAFLQKARQGERKLSSGVRSINGLEADSVAAASFSRA